MISRLRALPGRLLQKFRLRARRDVSGVQVALVLNGAPFARAAGAPDGSGATVPEVLEGPKLNVGGGKGHPVVPGWQIVDLRERTADIVMDITTDPLPFPDGSVAVVFCSHTLEHIPRNRLGFVLSEFRRVLKPDGHGLLRVLVPDIELALRAYLDHDHAFFDASEISLADPGAPLGGKLASWFYSSRKDEAHGGGHVHCFDFEYLATWLREAGFTRVWRSEYRASVLPELRGDAFDRHPHDSLCVEAIA